VQNLQSVIEIIQQVCDRKKISVNKALTESGVGKDLIANMLKGRIPAANKIADLAVYLGVSTDYLLGLSGQQQNNFIETRMEKMEKEKEVSFYNQRQAELWKAIAREWGVNFEELGKDLAKNFFIEEEVMGRVTMYSNGRLNEQEKEIKKQLEKNLCLKLPLRVDPSLSGKETEEELEERKLKVQIKVTPFPRFIMKKTNELDKDVVESLAKKLDLSPASIISWGTGERIPNRRCMDLLYVELEPAEYLVKIFDKLIELEEKSLENSSDEDSEDTAV